MNTPPNHEADLVFRITGDYGGCVYTLLIDWRKEQEWFIPYGYGCPTVERDREKAIAKMRADFAKGGLTQLMDEKGPK